MLCDARLGRLTPHRSGGGGLRLRFQRDCRSSSGRVRCSATLHFVEAQASPPHSRFYLMRQHYDGDQSAGIFACPVVHGRKSDAARTTEIAVYALLGRHWRGLLIFHPVPWAHGLKHPLPVGTARCQSFTVCSPLHSHCSRYRSAVVSNRRQISSSLSLMIWANGTLDATAVTSTKRRTWIDWPEKALCFRMRTPRVRFARRRGPAS